MSSGRAMIEKDSMMQSQLSPLETLEEKFIEAQLLYEEALTAFRQSDSYDQLDLARELPSLFYFVDLLASRFADWERLAHAQEQTPGLARDGKRFREMALDIGGRFASACAYILFQGFSEYTAARVRHHAEQNEKILAQLRSKN